MKYYKIIQDNTFLGVVTSDNLVRYQQKHDTFIGTSEERGEFIEFNNKLYRDTWMNPSAYDTEGVYEIANVIEVTKDFYDEYKTAIENNIIINDDYEDDTPQMPKPLDILEQLDLDFMRSEKIKEMSSMCRITIENGFSLELQNETKHFSLTTQDQLNLMSLSIMAQTQSVIPYHADGEACEFYTADEINKIITAAAEFKNYNLAYYNSLKTYINALETIEEVFAITYGTPIPEEYKSDVLKVLEY